MFSRHCLLARIAHLVLCFNLQVSCQRRLYSFIWASLCLLRHICHQHLNRHCRVKTRHWSWFGDRSKSLSALLPFYVDARWCSRSAGWSITYASAARWALSRHPKADLSGPLNLCSTFANVGLRGEQVRWYCRQLHLQHNNATECRYQSPTRYYFGSVAYVVPLHSRSAWT